MMATNRIPVKVQRLLNVVAKYTELTVVEVEPTPWGTRTWDIRSTADQVGRVWIYWTPAANGGSVRVTRYYGPKNERQITQAQAPISIALLAGH